MKRIFAALAVYLVLESFYPPDAQLSARAGEGAIRGYQATISKAFHSLGATCHFTPTCSEYGRLAIRKYGFLRGGVKAVIRIMKCAPWGPPPGGADPP